MALCRAAVSSGRVSPTGPDSSTLLSPQARPSASPLVGPRAPPSPPPPGAGGGGGGRGAGQRWSLCPPLALGRGGMSLHTAFRYMCGSEASVTAPLWTLGRFFRTSLLCEAGLCWTHRARGSGLNTSRPRVRPQRKNAGFKADLEGMLVGKFPSCHSLQYDMHTHKHTHTHIQMLTPMHVKHTHTHTHTSYNTTSTCILQ